MHKQQSHTDAQEQPASDAGLLTHLRISIIAAILLALIVCGLYPLIVWGLSQAIFHDKANGSLITDPTGQVIGSKLIGQPFSDTKYFHPRPSAAGSGYDATASGGSNLGPTSAKLFNGTTKPSTLPATQPGGDPLPGPVVVDFDGIKLRVFHYCDDNNVKYQATRDGKPIAPEAFNTEFKNAAGWDDVKLVNAFSDADHPILIAATSPIPPDAVTASASGLDPHISIENANLQASRVAAARNMSIDSLKKLISENTDRPDLGLLGDPGVNVLLLNLALDKNNPVPTPPTTQPTTAPAASSTHS